MAVWNNLRKFAFALPEILNSITDMKYTSPDIQHSIAPSPDKRQQLRSDGLGARHLTPTL